MRIVLTGPPGAGKRTQAGFLVDTFGVPHISTGDLFRHHIATGTDLGRSVQAFLDAGELVASEVTIAVVADRLNDDDAQAGFILDGFPRTSEQARALDGILERTGDRIDLVLDFDIAADEVVARLLARGRSDDTEDVIRRRLEVYRTERDAVLSHYAADTTSIDAAAGDPAAVRAQVASALTAAPSHP